MLPCTYIQVLPFFASGSPHFFRTSYIPALSFPPPEKIRFVPQRIDRSAAMACIATNARGNPAAITKENFCFVVIYNCSEPISWRYFSYGKVYLSSGICKIPAAICTTVPSDKSAART